MEGESVTGGLPRVLAEARFADLYRDNARDLLGYALRRSMDPDDAADVVAETFLIAWRRLGDVPAGVEARLWLYGTARRVLANHTRGVRRRDRLTHRLRDQVRHQLPFHREQEASALLDALVELRQGDRELLTLIAWEELTPREAAKALGISSAAARTRLHRARRRLRARLAERPRRNSIAGQEIEVEEAR
jgi:RNA polymerase sigma-70 factor (ECF subfamily)